MYTLVMTQSIAILGRQPALGLAELESLYGHEKITPLGKQTALIDIDPCLLAFDRLGGSVKFGKLLTTLDTTNWQEIERFLVSVSPEHSKQMVAGKMQLGLSVIDLNVTLKQMQITGLTLKKAIRQTGRSVRLIPNKSLELNTAQVLHNHLTGPTGWELYFIRHKQQTFVAQTIKIQDIKAYAARDQVRPKRDARVGMLPPKLAQIIINLAVGQLPADTLSSICEIPAGDVIPRPRLDQTILDPFCGTGVLLQEALLMGYNAIGTDLEPRMTQYSQTNLDWLAKRYNLEPNSYKFAVGDATKFNWFNSQLTTHNSPLAIACETYLGRPFSALPKPEILRDVMTDVDTIHKKFLQNIARQTKPGFRMCLAVPAWAQRSQLSANSKQLFSHLKVLDNLSDLGYTRSVFTHVDSADLIYHRPEQIVARELVVLTRK